MKAMTVDDMFAFLAKLRSVGYGNRELHIWEFEKPSGPTFAVDKDYIESISNNLIRDHFISVNGRIASIPVVKIEEAMFES